MEKYLSRFKLPEAPAGLRQQVLASAQAYRQQKQETELSATFAFGVKIFLSAAAIILVSIMVLNSLSYSRVESNRDKYKAEIEQLVSIGVSKQYAVIIIAAMDDGGREINLNRQQLIKGDLL